MKQLLELRKRMNAKRPKFKHYEHQKRKEVGTRWRKPRGLHNKMRIGKWGKPASVNVGYRGPAEVRGLDRSGLTPNLVSTLSQLDALDPKKHSVILSRVGNRAKVQLLESCKKKHLSVLNVKNMDEELKHIASTFAERKNAKKERLRQKESNTAPAPKKTEQKTEEKTPEQEKKEKDKVLTQRE